MTAAELAFVYHRAGGNWPFAQRLGSVVLLGFGNFGGSIAMAGAHRMIAAEFETGEDTSGGAVYAYTGPVDAIFKSGFE